MVVAEPLTVRTRSARTLLSVGLRAVLCQTLCNRATGDGLVPAFEVLLGNAAVKALIKEGKISQVGQIMSTQGREAGMSTQEQSLRNLVKKNLVTEQEAFRRAIRPEEFKKVLSLPY